MARQSINGFIQNAALATGLFLAGMAVHTTREISETMAALRVDMAIVMTKLASQEERINRLEFGQHPDR